MSTEDVILLVVCVVVALVAAGVGVLAYRRHRRRTALALGIGAAVTAIGIHLSGIAALLWSAILAVVTWAAGIPASTRGVIGMIVLAVGVVTVVVSVLLGRRGRDRTAHSSFELVSRAKESPRQRRRREKTEAKQHAAEAKRQARQQKADDKQQRADAKQHRAEQRRAGTEQPTPATGQQSDGRPADPAEPLTVSPAAAPTTPAATPSVGPPAEPSPIEEVPDRPSDPTAAGQLPPMAPGR